MTLIDAKGPCVAGIDMGSKSIRISVYQDTSEGLVVVHTERDPIALGEQGFDANPISDEMKETLVAIFERYAETLNRFDVAAYMAVATSAVRNASNGPEVLARIQAETGVDVQLIDGEEEAVLAYEGVVDVVGPCMSPRWLVDIGGGSAEIIADRPGGPVGIWSFPLGSWRFPELCQIEGIADPAPMLLGVQDQIREVLKPCEEAEMPEGSPVVALGGNVRALGWILSQRHGTPAEAPPMAPLAALLPELARYSIEERCEQFEVASSRAHTLTSTATILFTIADFFGVDDVITPHLNLRRSLVAFVTCFVSSDGRLAEHEYTSRFCRGWNAS